MSIPPIEMRARRVTAGDRELARELFALMARVFDEDAGPLGDAYLDALLARPDFWAVAALAAAGDGGEAVGGETVVGEAVVGGVTAHALPMTRAESWELFIYDVAVHPDHQRRGVGRLLLTTLRAAAADAGIGDAFVPADDEDVHACDFYRALGGEPSPVTMFTFAGDGRGPS